MSFESRKKLLTNTVALAGPNMFIVRPGRLILKPVLASAIMGVVSYFLHDFNLIFNYVVSTSVYFILLLIMRGLYPEEMVFLKDLLRKARWNW